VVAARSATTPVLRAAAPDAGPAQGTVVSSSDVAAPARPAAPIATLGPVSSWQPVQRVSVEKPAVLGEIARVSDPPSSAPLPPSSLDVPVLQPIAVAGANAPGDPPATPIPEPRVEPQAVVLNAPHAAVQPAAPREFAKQPLPPYVVEPPDILLVTAGAAVTLPNRPIEGQHLVRPDGTIGLGVYGNVYVAGLTLEEARDAIAAQIHVSVNQKTIEDIKKELVVDVLAYNSKVYYVITDGGGYGEQVYPIPVTGNETVLDALSKINGLPPVASKKRIWVARATPNCDAPNILPVDWCGITQRGCADTNYQVFPNDRIYVASDKWIAGSAWLRKRLDPIQQLFGVTLLGSSTVNSIRTNGRINSANNAP
jgi:polysaccharide export outer membrane protein